MSMENSVVAIYDTHTDADRPVKELQRGGVDMHKLSIVGKGYHTDEQVVGYYNAGDRMKYWGEVGAFWGGFWGLLFGSALFIAYLAHGHNQHAIHHDTEAAKLHAACCDSQSISASEQGNKKSAA